MKNFTTLSGLLLALACAFAPGAAAAATTLSAFGTIHPTGAPPPNCTVCVVPEAGVLQGLDVPLFLVGTETEYLKTIVGNGAGGPCLHVTSDVVGTSRNGASTLRLQVDGTTCARGRGPDFTFTGSYVIVGGTGMFQGARGVGSLSSVAPAGDFSMSGSITNADR